MTRASSALGSVSASWSVRSGRFYYLVTLSIFAVYKCCMPSCHLRRLDAPLNTLTLIDATYKSTKYSIPLFFWCVKINVSNTVVAEFTIQSETSEHILEALSILKSWNPYKLQVYNYHALPEHHSSFKAPPPGTHRPAF